MCWRPRPAAEPSLGAGRATLSQQALGTEAGGRQVWPGQPPSWSPGWAAEGAEGRGAGWVAPHPFEKMLVLRLWLRELRKSMVQSWGSHWFPLSFAGEGPLKTGLCFLGPKALSPGSGFRGQGSETSVRPPGPQHLVLSLEEQVSMSLLLMSPTRVTCETRCPY